MHRYGIILYWSNEDQAFIAEVPELPGCMAHGDDQESALKNIKDAMQFRIDTAQELGQTVPEPKGERLMYAWSPVRAVRQTDRPARGRDQSN